VAQALACVPRRPNRNVSPKTDPADERYDFAVPKSIQETQSLPTKLSPLSATLTKVLILNDFLDF
jgi:hypothetical protein